MASKPNDPVVQTPASSPGTPAPVSPRDDDARRADDDLSSGESVAGEEDPGAAADMPASPLHPQRTARPLGPA